MILPPLKRREKNSHFQDNKYSWDKKIVETEEKSQNISNNKNQNVYILL